jgi:hypothetical protein
MNIIRYTAEMKTRWNAFVDSSKNATFLFKRDYMDYHSDHFSDHCLLFVDDKNKLLALMPANQKEDALVSHGGLTYGGILSDASMTTPRMFELFDMLKLYAHSNGIKRIIYKTIPHIYSRIPAQEDQYALFRHGALLSRRDVLAVIEKSNHLPYQARRKRKISQARNAKLEIKKSVDYKAFWIILEENLLRRYKVKPVHSLSEITLLAGYFPEHIHLHICSAGKKILAGMVVYVTDDVAHVQYISTSEDGRNIGALDLLFAELIEHVYADKRYFDFGISTEQNGKMLNLGLIEQKEGFGARAVVHDQYEMAVR